MVYHLRSIYLPQSHCALWAMCNCWLSVYVYSSGCVVHGCSDKKGVPLVIIIWACLFSQWSLWCGMVCALHPSIPAAHLLALTRVTSVCERRPRPRSSASNKRPLINHASPVTHALLAALVREIDLVCALLHRRPGGSVLHIFQGVAVSG